MITSIEKHSYAAWFIVLIIASFIFYVSSLTLTPGTGGWSIKPIIYHGAVFFALSFFLSIALIRAKKTSYIPFVIILGILYAVSDELHQLLVPGRFFSFYDIFLDTLGVMAGLTLYLITLEKRHLL